MSRPTDARAATRVGTVLREATRWLRDGGIATARQDAELLLGDALGATRLALHLAPERPVDPEALVRFETRLARRADHEPLQYILGADEFRGLRLAVGPGVFIPRPETELLVERALARCAEGPAAALDLCAGSGAVACALAVRRPRLMVWAVELSAEAARWTRLNVQRLGLGGRVSVLEGDLFAPLAGLGLAGRCDLVVGNPPYLARPTLPRLPEEVRAWEPALALDGGPDGLAIIERILDQAPEFTAPGGRVLLEIGHDHADRLRSRLGADPRYGAPVFSRDLLGHERVLDVATQEVGGCRLAS